MNKKALLYEGKAKKIYETDDPRIIIQEFKDSATAFDGKKTGVIEGKGHINAKLSTILFTKLSEDHIENHFVSFVEPASLVTKKLSMIPVEVVVRNVAAGSLSKRVGYPEGTTLSKPIVELYYKNDALGDPIINEMHAVELSLATPSEISQISQIALNINKFLMNFFSKCDLILVDFKLEFGRLDDKVLLGDEISPDTCRLWDAKTKDKLDKDRFRRDLGNVEGAYREVLKRAEKIFEESLPH